MRALPQRRILTLSFFFPEEVLPVNEGNLPKKPKEPKAPRRPRGALDLAGLAKFYEPPRFLPSVLEQMIPTNYGGVPVIDAGEKTVRISYSALKHGFDFTSDVLVFRFTEPETVRAFSVDFRLSADELPDALEGKLHFRLDDQSPLRDV